MDLLPDDVRQIIYRYSNVPKPPPNPTPCHTRFTNDRYIAYKLPAHCDNLANPISYIRWAFKSKNSSGTKCSYGYCTHCKEIVLKQLLENARPRGDINIFQTKDIIQYIKSDGIIYYNRNNVLEICNRGLFFAKHYGAVPGSIIALCAMGIVKPKLFFYVAIGFTLAYCYKSIQLV